MHRILKESTDERIIRALGDAGRLIGRSLAGPVLMLNPAGIVLSGSLALDHVKHAIERGRTLWQHLNEPAPGRLDVLPPRENTYSVARGAALAVFRGQLVPQVR